jgi:hypothetical protein
LNLRKATALFAIVMGASMVGMWAMFLASGQVPELIDAPYRIGFHLAAEFLTGLLLLLAGFGLLAVRPWAGQLFLLATGMLLYAVVQAPGYFIQLGQAGFAGMFAVFIVLTLGFAALAMRVESSGRGNAKETPD